MGEKGTSEAASRETVADSAASDVTNGGSNTDATDGASNTDATDETLNANATDGASNADATDRTSNAESGPPDVPLPWNTLDDETTGHAVEREEFTPDSFEDLKFVGSKTAAVLRESDLSLPDLANRRVAYRELTAAGVNPGVAARIRREHSLSWSFESGGDDLERRSAQVRGLHEEERAWIAASSGWADGFAEDTDADEQSK